MANGTKHVRLADATQVLAALNTALQIDAGPTARIESLLCSFRRLLDRDDASCALLLQEQLDRQPVPLVVQQYLLHSPLSPAPPKQLHETQSIEDQSKPLQEILLAHVLKNPRTPTTVICSRDVDRGWFEEVLVKQLLEPMHCLDVMVSSWAASPDRKIDLVVFQHAPHRPFEDGERDLANLMLCAIGPFVDREIFRAADVIDRYGLTSRQKDVLRRLLCGDTEKEVAAELHRSLHTIHGHVKQIYRALHVQNRGELMALFVDQTILAALAAPADDGGQTAPPSD